MKLVLKPLDSNLFPGITSSIKLKMGSVMHRRGTHNFVKIWPTNLNKRFATAVLAAVKTAMSKYATTKVAVVGHLLSES